MTNPRTDRARIVLVEPYFGGSHRVWAEGLVASSRHEIHLVTHPDRLWRWRMRGGAVTLAESIRAYIADRGPPDALVATDMVDLAALLGFLRRELADVPVGLYLHENQLAYPLAPSQRFDEGLALVNWKSMAVADRIWFNSRYHRQVMFDALPELLDRPADHRHGHLLGQVADRAAVLPVGLDVASLVRAERPHTTGPPLVAWNQRWDHDKDPAVVFHALADLAGEGVDFRLALAGENNRADRSEFAWVQEQLGERVIHVGPLKRDSYLELLLRADVVATAAVHEFFGIAPVEAMAAGAVPVLPDRLSYPEIIPTEYHDAVLYPDDDLLPALRRVLTDLDGARAAVEGLRSSTMRYDWATVGPHYDEAFATLAAAQ